MRQLTIADIRQLENNEVIPSFTGKIKKVFEQKKGDGQYGPWFFQNMIVANGTEEITATWTGEDTMDSWTGKTVTFESVNGTHGLNGVTRDIRSKGDKTYEGVKITAAAKLRVGTNGASHSDQGPSQPRQESHVELDSDPVGEARKSAMKMVNGFNIALSATNHIAENYERDNFDKKPALGNTLRPEQLQAICSSIFISLDRQGAISKLPSEVVKVTKESKLPEKVAADTTTEEEESW